MLQYILIIKNFSLLFQLINHLKSFMLSSSIFFIKCIEKIENIGVRRIFEQTSIT
jgi:hypothetical protein